MPVQAAQGGRLCWRWTGVMRWVGRLFRCQWDALAGHADMTFEDYHASGVVGAARGKVKGIRSRIWVDGR